MSTRFHIGAKGLRGAVAAYAKRFDLLEVPAVAGNPTVATMRKWRKAVPPHFEFAVIAGPHVSRPKTGPELDRDLATTRSAIDALQARVVIVRTPAEVTPSAAWRDRLGKLFAKLPGDVTTLVWEPTGLWETGDAAVAAKAWGVVVAVDPAKEPVPAGPVAYVRLRALGETRSFGPAALERIVRAIGERRDVYAVLETDSALDECKRLRQLAQRSKSADTGGMARLVRPRGGIVVRDDEQE